MTSTWTRSLTALAVSAAFVLACTKTDPASATSPVARGKYLVDALGCADCHTPMQMGAQGPEPMPGRHLSGHPEAVKLPPPPAASGPWIASTAATMTAWAGPWGVSYPANLTPDKETGLGGWTADTFIATLRTGRHEGHGREILPPMPWPAYRNLSDDDLRAVFAYLQSLPAVKNRVPQPLPPQATGSEPAPAPAPSPAPSK